MDKKILYKTVIQLDNSHRKFVRSVPAERVMVHRLFTNAPPDTGKGNVFDILMNAFTSLLPLYITYIYVERK